MAPQKTDYATVAIEDTAPQEDAASYTNEGRWLVTSEVITVVAARAWEFSVPLALLGPPGPHASLRAPAALALATTLATATLAPPTGAWADRSDRRRASRVARLAQILGTALGVLRVTDEPTTPGGGPFFASSGCQMKRPANESKNNGHVRCRIQLQHHFPGKRRIRK